MIFLFLALFGATFGKIYPCFFQCKAISLLLPFFCIFLVLTLELHFSPVSFFSVRFLLFLANLWRHFASMDLIQVLSWTVPLQKKHGRKVVFVVAVVVFFLLATCHPLLVPFMFQVMSGIKYLIHSTLELIKSGKSALHNYGSPQHDWMAGDNSDHRNSVQSYSKNRMETWNQWKLTRSYSENSLRQVDTHRL